MSDIRARDEIVEGKNVPSTAGDSLSDEFIEPEFSDASVDETIGLALSGGGVRAALFSLGVLLCFVDSGKNRQVRSIASVSGGSIVNAAVAQEKNFAEYQSLDEFDPVAKDIAESLAVRGVFAFSARNLVSLFAILIRVLAPFIAILVAGMFNLDHYLNFTANVPWRIAILAGLLVLAVTVLLLRGNFQRIRYSALLKSKSKPLEDPALSNFDDGAAHHVLVSTDLLSGQPIYFAKEFVVCAPYGWGKPGNFPTAKAVYASAAFPVVFPPLSIKMTKFNFQNGVAQPPFPHRLQLADGGVFNNLGTDWFHQLERQMNALWKFGELTLDFHPVDRLIVVNAGAPSKALHRLLPFKKVARTMSVLYDNTVVPRVESILKSGLDGHATYPPIVINIAESPIELAQRLADSSDRVEVKSRASNIEGLLKRQPSEFWSDLARQTSGTRTKLSRAGRETAARLMLHGYLSALVLLFSIYDIDVDSIRGEQYFLHLAGRR